MRRLSREEERRGEEARRLTRREEKKTEKEKPEPLIEMFRFEQSHDVPPSWEAGSQPETAPGTKTQIRGKGEAQDEGPWSSHAWQQRESTTDKEPSTDHSDYYSSASPQGYSGGHPTAERSRDGISFSCLHPECTSRPFKRQADLQRHCMRTHSDEPDNVYSCDYRGCFREGEPFHRLDHFRDHLRQYHGEDIPKRGASSAMRSERTKWWRCTRCLGRVHVSQHGFECPNCETESRLEGNHSQSGSLQKGS